MESDLSQIVHLKRREVSPWLNKFPKKPSSYFLFQSTSFTQKKKNNNSLQYANTEAHNLSLDAIHTLNSVAVAARSSLALTSAHHSKCIQPAVVHSPHTKKGSTAVSHSPISQVKGFQLTKGNHRHRTHRKRHQTTAGTPPHAKAMHATKNENNFPSRSSFWHLPWIRAIQLTCHVIVYGCMCARTYLFLSHV